jgi:hypothetical protein
MLYLVLEWAAVLLICWFWWSQIFWPAMHGRKWFPIFRSSQVAREEQLREEKSREVEVQLEKDIRETIQRRNDESSK